MTLPEDAKHAGDLAALTVLGGTLVEWLPAVAALFTIVWTGIRIWESATVQGVVARLRRRGRG